VAGRIEEGDRPSVVGHLIGGDVLGDATRFAGSHIRLADCVKESGLAVVDVAQNGDDRRAALERGRSFIADHAAPVWRRRLVLDRLGFRRSQGPGLEPELFDDDGCRVEIDLLVDVRHHPIRHQLFDDIDGACFNPFRQIPHRKRGGNFDDFVAVLAHDLTSTGRGERAALGISRAVGRRTSAV